MAQINFKLKAMLLYRANSEIFYPNTVQPGQAVTKQVLSFLDNLHAAKQVDLVVIKTTTPRTMMDSPVVSTVATRIVETLPGESKIY